MVKKHIPFSTMCYNPQLGRDKPLGAAAFVNLVYHYGSHDDPGHGLSTLSTAGLNITNCTATSDTRQK